MDVCVSSWHRVAPNTLPALAKAGGNYLSSQLIGSEARRLGFAEGIGAVADGTLSEGSGENLFLVKDGMLLTPPLAALGAGRPYPRQRHPPGARARHRGARVLDLRASCCTSPTRLFFTGTAVEITPIRSVDRITIGGGKRGPITESLQKAFFGLFNGKTQDKWGWLDYVDMAAPRVADRRLDEHAPPQTLFEKVWQRHEVIAESAATPAVLYIDLHLVHEVTSPQAFTRLRERGLHGAPPRAHARDDGPLHAHPHRPGSAGHPDRDRLRPPRRSRAGGQLRRLRRRAAGLKHAERGIVHVIGPELGSPSRARPSSAATATPVPTAPLERWPSASAPPRSGTCSAPSACCSASPHAAINVRGGCRRRDRQGSDPRHHRQDRGRGRHRPCHRVSW